MAKLQRTFLQGKMNKDLDERLIPNGQYRDAQNIQVSTSEGSDVGAVENMLGNTLQNLKSTGPDVFWPKSPGPFGLTNPVCIGVIKDSQNEKIYWFLSAADSNTDAVVEYDQVTKIVAPILVDVNGILNFNKLSLITGVNILEGMLMWTDDLNEPRLINIPVFKAGSTDFATQTNVYGRPFEASDVNVIKLKPGTSPGYVAAPSNRAGSTNGTGITPVTTTGTFTSNSGGVQLPLAIGSSTTITTNLAANWIPNDIVIISTEYINALNYTIYLEVRAEVTAMYGNSLVTLTILSISQGLTGLQYIWDCLLEEDEAMFNINMPRFAYRWKYNDNLYSAFSPWTEVVFVPNVYDYDPQNAYNTAMTNNIRKLTINGFETPPADVESIDILYKDSNSTLVYKVDDIPAATTTFSITSELIYNVINSNQLIRAYDNVPRKAKSQELIGNRIVYGNYLQNYNIDSAVDLTVASTSSDIATLLYPQASVKSIRSYQVGIVYLDVNGRETPVFTNDTATINIPKIVSDKANAIKVTSAQATPGTWATHFKYYIKDISNEYYNLILDRYYDSDDGNIWLSFPSAERNKVEIDDFIILKKENNTNVAVSEDAKYKIIDISNEAPDSVKTQRINKLRGDVSVGTSIVSTGLNFLPINSGLSEFNFVGPTFDEDRDFYEIWSNGAGKLYIQFSAVLGTPLARDTSQIYEVVSGGFNLIDSGTSKAFYNVVLSEAISSNDNFLDGLTATQEYTITVYQDEITNSPAFEGKFFAKINRDAAFENAVIYNFTGNQGDYNVTSTVPFQAQIATTPGASQPVEIDGWGWQENTSTGASPSPFLFQPSFGSTQLGIGYAPYPSGGFNAALPSGKLEANLVAGGVIQFNTLSGGWGDIYEIASVIVTNNTPRYNESPAQTLKQFRITLTTPYIDQGTGLIEYVRVLTRKRNLGITFNQFTKVLSSPNAAIFETEPSEAIDLELYYEASNSIPIGDLNVEQTLPYFNCYSFGNGVESNRIRDDYNAKTIGKGVKVSSILEDVYKEERRGAGLIYSGIFNSTSGVNELNQFIAGLKITKDLNPSYGTIQKLHARDTDLIVLMEDKVFRVLADKDALYNADGNSNVTSNNNVLGQTIPFVGEYGISKNPESFASFGFRSYFTDKARGTVMRLSRDGLTDIGEKGMSYFFQNAFKTNVEPAIIGAYDSDVGSYNVVLGSEGLSFKERADGWNTRMSYDPEFGVSLNNEYYTFKDGSLWEHSNLVRSNFYGVQYESTVTPIFNDAPTSIKNFKTLSYEGDAGWTASITTNEQSGEVNTWKKREGIYFNYIIGDGTFFLAKVNGDVTNNNTIVIAVPNTNISVGDTVTGAGISGIVTVSSIAADKITIGVTGSPQTLANKTELTFTKVADIDTSEFSVMGIGNVLRHDAPYSVIIVNGEINVSLQPGDIILTDDPGNALKVVGTVLSINRTTNTITLTAASPVVLSTAPAAFILFAKNTEANTSGLLGYYGEVILTTASSDKKELFAVNSEIFISSE
jgi:hypothetical protein